MQLSVFRDYGAKGGGEDDTLAFGKAWNAACSSSTPASLVVPNGKTYLLKPITFSGPCKSTVQVMIMGNIEASSNPSDWKGKNQRIWILFGSLNNLQVGGGGTINGNGRPCKDAPTALTFTSCSGLTVNNLIVKDSQQIHVEFKNCDNVVASSLTISSPQNSPNTDGIHVTGTTNINITNCNIATGDDCISIVTGSHTVRANGITCGPGHGISIGSLGEDGSNDQVSDVIVDTATLSGTSNGVRIKTWQGGNGYANSIIFKNIKMNNVENPIIIDQSYCDSKKPCKQQRSAVKISNVQYKNIKGTSASRNAINFNCSKNVPCSDILLEDINLVEEDGEAKSFCSNVVKLTKQGDVFPSPCN
ncbi:hypothetical protein HPP92_016947 [Vanilla planifolia]|uniref:endo-polygalacturonase n=1 Tax=Vanilla planifolia TaxID=51239 RepID=A0A835QFR1_VANPL|nr:hypothetical protein HPP92_016947 [Vanilla planifolia]